jgi:hypothetical protein
MKRLQLLSLAAAAAAGLGGCYSQFNATQRIAGVVDLNDLDPRAPQVTLDGPPSGESIDRTAWPRQTFIVPQDAVVTAPAYSPLRRWTVASARQVGDSPGTIDAATVDPVDNELAEAILMPLATVYDLVAIIPRAICARPTTPTLNPRGSYQRSTRRWADPLPITGAAAAEDAAAQADRVLRERYGDSLLLDEVERGVRQPTPREPMSGQRT